MTKNFHGHIKKTEVIISNVFLPICFAIEELQKEFEKGCLYIHINLMLPTTKIDNYFPQLIDSKDKYSLLFEILPFYYMIRCICDLS